MVELRPNYYVNFDPLDVKVEAFLQKLFIIKLEVFKVALLENPLFLFDNLFGDFVSNILSVDFSGEAGRHLFIRAPLNISRNDLYFVHAVGDDVSIEAFVVRESFLKGGSIKTLVFVLSMDLVPLNV